MQEKESNFTVMGVYPREAMTLKVVEGIHGWWAAAYTGDGSKPGSLVAGAGSFETAEEAFQYLCDHTHRWLDHVHDSEHTTNRI